MTDEELVQRHTEGEETAFPELVSRYARPMYAFVYRLTGSDDSQDIVQDIFIKVWKNLGKFDGEKRFKTWIFTIARNAAFDQLRKRKIAIFSEIDTSNADTDSGDGFGDSIADESMLADEIAHQAELGKSLSHALATLPPAHRAVVILHDFNEMTFEEIAEMSDVPMNTVKSQYRRSLITLRKLLVGDDAPKP